MVAASVLGMALLHGCGSPALNVRIADVNPVPTSDSVVSLSAGGGTVRFVQPVDLAFTGESTDVPEGSAELSLAVHVSRIELGGVAVPVDRTVERVVPYEVRAGDLQGAATTGVELEVPLDAAASDALRSRCGQRVPVWFEATWKAGPRGSLPSGWTIAGAGGELHNLLEQPTAAVACADAPHEAPAVP